jgi:hypothetical protein
MARLRPRLNHGTVVAYLALFVALGSGAYAATQLPEKSVGTKQLKKDAVKSGKVAPNTLTGADIAEGTLGRVPSAANALQAANAAKLGGVAPNDYVKDGEKVQEAGGADIATTASFATEATNAGNFDNLDSNQFLQIGTEASGDLTGPFSNLQLDDDSVTGVEVQQAALSAFHISDYARVSTALFDAAEDSDPATQVFLNTGGFIVRGRCVNGPDEAVTGSINIAHNQANWSLDSNADNGRNNAVDLASNAQQDIVLVGPTIGDAMSGGSYTAMAPTGYLHGIVGVRVNRLANTCDITHTVFGPAT